MRGMRFGARADAEGEDGMRAHRDLPIRFPKRFRRCWSSAIFRRRYWRAWWRQRAREQEFLKAHAEKNAAWRSKPENRRTSRRATRRWRKENADAARRSRRRHYLATRKRCHFCGAAGLPGRCGSGALRPMERNVIRHDGKFEARTVLVCRACRGGR